jgi:hypothetical protein
MKRLLEDQTDLAPFKIVVGIADPAIFRCGIHRFAFPMLTALPGPTFVKAAMHNRPNEPSALLVVCWWFQPKRDERVLNCIPCSLLAA